MANLPPPLENISISAIRPGFLNNPSPGPPRDPEKSCLIMEDVQRVLREDLELIDEFKEISHNSEFNDFIEIMKNNPKKGKDILTNDPEIANMFRKFSGIIGNHFERLAGKDDEIKFEPIGPPIKPIVAETLRDPGIIELISRVKSGSVIDPRAIMHGSPDLGKKIKLLIDEGFLSLNSN